MECKKLARLAEVANLRRREQALIGNLNNVTALCGASSGEAKQAAHKLCRLRDRMVSLGVEPETVSGETAGHDIYSRWFGGAAA